MTGVYYRYLYNIGPAYLQQHYGPECTLLGTIVVPVWYRFEVALYQQLPVQCTAVRM